jgi:hypothetical protein
MALNHGEIDLNRKGKDPTWDEHNLGSGSGLGPGLMVNWVELVDGPRRRGKRASRLSQAVVQRGFIPWPLREGKSFPNFQAFS